MNPPVGKILLVDDDDDCNTFAKLLIEKGGFAKEIEIAHNGKEALDMINSGSTLPAIIFLDINMPVMNGWEFLEEFKKLDSKKTSSIQVVAMLTSSTNPDDKSKTQDNNAVFLSKPITAEKIQQILSKL